MKNLLRCTIPAAIFFTIACNKTESSAPLQSSSVDDISGLSNNLVAWYTFNGDILDHSNYGNNIDFNNATPTAGRSGVANTAYYFDGATSYMTVPGSAESLSPKHQITLAAVIKPMGFYEGECHANRIIDKGDDDTPGAYYLSFDDAAYYNYDQCDKPVIDTAENFYGVFGNAPNNVSARDKDYLKVNKWYTIVFTVDSNKVGRLYVNNVLKATQPNTAAHFSSNPLDLYIGRMIRSDYPFWFHGIIDEIRIYNKALDVNGVAGLTQDMAK